MIEAFQLTGSITVSRRLAGHWVWQREPLCAGAAWLDLLMLARTDAGEITINGSPVALARGDVGWAQHSLAEKWKRSREWVSRFLDECADRGMVELRPVSPGNPRRGTVIRILNYDAYNREVTTTDPASESATDPTTDPASNPTQRGKKEEEEGRGKHAREEFAEIPSVAEVRTWASMSMVDPDYAEEQHAKVTETAGWTPNGRLLDWRKRWLRFWNADRAVWLTKKNSARGGASRQVDGPPVSLATPVVTLSGMRAAVG